MLPLLFLVIGLALGAAAAWLRLGRTDGARSWVGDEQHERAVLVTLPAVAVVLLGLALGRGTGSDLLTSLGMGVAGVAMVSILLWNVSGLPMPSWSLPAWYRARTAHRPSVRDRRKARSAGKSGTA